MRKLNRVRYWVLGLLAGLLCWGSPPAIAHLVPHPVVESPTSAIAQAPLSLEQQAQTAYQQGQYQTATDLLGQAQQQYEAQGEVVKAAIALSNLSLTYQQLGQWDAAQTALETAQRYLENQPTALSVQAQILTFRGNCSLPRARAMRL